MIVCTTVNDDYRVEVFSKATKLILMDTSRNIIHVEDNPALLSPSKRPTVAKRCVELGANVVIAAHGSVCYPSYRILRQRNVKIYVTEPGSDLSNVNVTPITQWEVLYSSIIAMLERLSGH
ncbi:NifB/NifX family molybdenum-iron cluster-binding protein [Caldivirga sp.]|uniref:NifB/NifX family molybdenum-iron cluster-binding protein n=1 Tax=Caldivirga sp. TaxID=2080243 RepID=UPI003D1037A6